MVFSNPVFLFLFLPIVLAVYGIAPRGLRNAVLLFASLVFYAWGEPRAVAVMLVSIAANYCYGRLLEGRRERDERGAKRLVALAVVTNLGLLIAFKYANWLWGDLRLLFISMGVESAHGWRMQEIPLPIGISFFTFQAMSYVVDVYRGQGTVQRKVVDFALYIALFPQLIAGPIVRYKDVAAQIVSRTVRRADFAQGVRRFVIGLGKKVLIADVLAVPADRIFDQVPGDQISFSVAWFGTLCFALQIYFDFSGYSDMAIGLSRMFGFRLLENFRWPLLSRSLTEFWRRWHISLATWFRDYLYIPLGGNRKGSFRTYFNLVSVFMLCGLWHGAAWTYILWGGYHATIMVFERAWFAAKLARWSRPAQHVYGFLVVMVNFAVFRPPTVPDVGTHLSAMFGFGGANAHLQPPSLFLDTEIVLAFVLGAAGSLPWLGAVWEWRRRLQASEGSRAARLAYDFSEAAVLVSILALCAIYVSADRYSPFIYFRF